MKFDPLAFARAVGADVKARIAAAVGPLADRIAALEARPVPTAPKSVTGALIARDGSLVLAMSDGSQVPLGVVVGRDGEDVDPVALAGMVRDEVAKAVAPLLERQDGEAAAPMTEAFVAPIVDRAVERAFAAMPKPENGKDADMDQIERLIGERIAAAVGEIHVPRDGEDGKSVTIEDVRPLIAEGIAEAVAALPPPQNGKDADMDALRAEAREVAVAAVAAIPAPENGKDADQGAILAAVMAAAREQIAAIPAPQDGKSVSLEDVAPLIRSAVETAVNDAIAEIPVPKDGVGLAGAVIDRDGQLVITLSNGDTKTLGVVVGKDGDPAAPAEPGKDGADGLGFDDLTLDYDGERTFAFRMHRGEKVKEFTFKTPITIYRGVFKDGAYERGDSVTWAGSLWIAQRETSSKPDVGGDWILAAKRGREGKAGRDGKDLTAPQPVKI